MLRIERRIPGSTARSIQSYAASYHSHPTSFKFLYIRTGDALKCPRRAVPCSENPSSSVMRSCTASIPAPRCDAYSSMKSAKTARGFCRDALAIHTSPLRCRQCGQASETSASNQLSGSESDFTPDKRTPMISASALRGVQNSSFHSLNRFKGRLASTS